ncbi:MAG: metal ABC transporter solute-binding protein, Zn/Mn family [Petrimonas sp.]|jgi:zinc transport system substrate-binding protein|nr:MAG: putative periplasmic iron-binding protein precursor [Bacteroidetes bacterium ADurb.BinA174]
MKKYIFALSLSSLLLACNSNREKTVNVLTVTIEPQRYFLEQIVGDKFQINTLVPPGSSPETYEPSPSAMIKLRNSKAYFKVGFLGYENVWTGKLSENNPNLKIVDCSTGIEPVYGGHGHHDHSHGDVEHEHADAADPHVWSSANNAVLFSQNMLNAMMDMDAENADFYRVNFEKLKLKITETDSVLTNLLRDIPSRSFIVYHPALAYFARDYDLKQYSIEFEGKNPSPAQMKELVDLAKAENIKTVFIQQEFDVKNTEVIAKEIGAKSYTINPLAYEWNEELIRIAQILADQGK